MAQDRTSRRSTGAYAPEGGDRGSGTRWLWWLLGLLLLIALAILLISLLSGDDDDKDKKKAKTPTTQTAPPATAGSTDTTPAPSASSGAAGGAGQITADGQKVLPLPSGGALQKYESKTAQGASVNVQSVVGDEAFWVGSSASDRVLVHLEISQESPFKVKVGDKVTLTGRVKPVDDSTPGQLGVTDTEGAALLKKEGEYIGVTKLGRG